MGHSYVLGIGGMDGTGQHSCPYGLRVHLGVSVGWCTWPEEAPDSTRRGSGGGER